MKKYSKAMGIILCVFATLFLLMLLLVRDFGIGYFIVIAFCYFIGIRNIRGAKAIHQESSTNHEASAPGSHADVDALVEYAKGHIRIAHHGELRDVDATESELELFDMLQSFVPEPLELVRKSDSYLTVCHGERDLVRFKFSERAHWISIQIVDSVRDEYKDSKLFAAQANKGQLFWKSNINDVLDIEAEPSYRELVLAAYNEGF